MTADLDLSPEAVERLAKRHALHVSSKYPTAATLRAATALALVATGGLYVAFQPRTAQAEAYSEEDVAAGEVGQVQVTQLANGKWRARARMRNDAGALVQLRAEAAAEAAE